jgi:hypothetical protein
MPGVMVTLVPYCEVDGIRLFTDTEVMALYDKISRDGLTEIVFPHGDITDARSFLEEMKTGSSNLYVVYVDDTIQAGIIWLNRFEGKACRVHFTSFSESWGMDTVHIGREAIKQILYMTNKHGEYVFDVLQGLTPSANIRAIRWLEKIGLKCAGEIPNVLWDAKKNESVNGTLMYLTRQEV